MFGICKEVKFYDPAGVISVDIEHGYEEWGWFCSGCTEGKLIQQKSIRSTKPNYLTQIPVKVTVGDIKFVEWKNNIKKLLLKHVDAYAEMISGQPLKKDRGKMSQGTS